MRAEWRRARAPEVAAADHDPACRDLTRALAGLTTAAREILLLVGMEGLDERQAAEALGLGYAACRKRLSRARAALAAALDERAVPSRAARAAEEIS